MNARFDSKTALSILALAAASLLLTRGLACALPLAAFGAFAAAAFERRAGVAAMLAAWLANQVVGFGWMDYPVDAATLGWGAALAAIGLASLAVSRLVLARALGWRGLGLAFGAAFAVYEGSVVGICAALGYDLSAFDAANVGRIFAINAAAFALMLACRVALARFPAVVPAGTFAPARRAP
jgi:hypothetical protein